MKAERDAIQARSQLELECLRRESEARVTASTAASAANAVQAQRPRAQAGRDYKDLQGEVSPEVADLFPQIFGFPQEEIVKIFQNKFKPISLYRLRHILSLTFDAYKDKE